MSVFTNPADGSREHAEAYIRAVLDLVAEREPLSVLRATGPALRAAVAATPADRLVVPELEGKWSVGHVLRHLADSEIVWAWRLRMALAHDRPPITGYDQDAWARRLRYERADPGESLEEFEVVRRGNLGLLEGASAQDLERVAVHEERGDESVRHMMRLYAGHDLLHLRQIERIRAANGEG